MPSAARRRHVSPLLHAVRAGDLASVRRLLDSWRSPPPFLPCLPRRRRAPLDNAVLAASALTDGSLLDMLLQSGATGDFMAETETLVGGTRVTPLHVATSNGLHDIMQTLIDANASVNRPDSQGRSPLHIAAWRCDVIAVRLLLHHGADVSAVTSRGETALQLAARYGHVELVRVLLERGASVFQPGQRGESALHIAAAEGHVPLIDMFCRYVDVNVRSSPDSAHTPLHAAATYAMLETVRFIVERYGADVNALDGQQQTALHRAVSRRHSARCVRSRKDYELTAEYLLARGVHVNQQDSAGQTALHLAARHHFPAVVDALFVHGVDARLSDKDGKTASQYVPDYDVETRRLFEQYANFGYLALGKSPLRTTPDLLAAHAQQKAKTNAKVKTEKKTEQETKQKAEGSEISSKAESSEIGAKAENETKPNVEPDKKTNAETETKVDVDTKLNGSEVIIDGDVTVICTNENPAPMSRDAVPNNVPVKIVLNPRVCAKDKIVLNDGRTIFRNVHNTS